MASELAEYSMLQRAWIENPPVLWPGRVDDARWQLCVSALAIVLNQQQASGTSLGTCRLSAWPARGRCRARLVFVQIQGDITAS